MKNILIELQIDNSIMQQVRYINWKKGTENTKMLIIPSLDCHTFSRARNFLDILYR